MSDNPLLDLEFRIPFDRIAAEHVAPAVEQLLADARAQLQAIIDAPRPRTFEGTMAALDAMTERLDDAMGVVGHLESSATTPDLRAAYNAAQPTVSAFYTSIPLSAQLWAAIKDYATTDDAKGLTGARRRFLEKTMADFRRHGADLDDAGKARLSEIDLELTKLTLRYGQNVLDSTNAFELVLDDEAKLAGLPPSAVDGARQSAAGKGLERGWRFTLQAPSYIAAMTYLDDAEVRERLYRAFNTRATSGDWDNRPIIARILELRRQRATLLGFASFADLVLEDRMAKRGDEARRFVATLREKTELAFSRENAGLVVFRRELEGSRAPTSQPLQSLQSLQPWDVSYYAEKQRRARFDFDEEALRPYFSADRVLSGLFELASRLYGIRIEPWPEAPTWHPSVKPWRVLDADGSWIASFYVDVFPRESKRDGAWMHGILTRLVPDATPPGRAPDVRQLEVLSANVTPPLGDAPALLTHREVETLFHEFGHLMHHALSRVQVRSLAGTNVAWDFVELPSMIMENWCWERDALDLFARHWQTNAPIPDDLLAKLRRARTFRAANAMMRQLGFAEVDLSLHVDFDPKTDGDVMSYARGIMQRYSAVPLPAEHAMIAAFTHLFASPVGYAAGYYSYKWAEVLEADAFSRFKSAGVFDSKVGGAFRDAILSRGDSDDPMTLYKDFMGREPSLDALLERSGLVSVEIDAPPAVL